MGVLSEAGGLAKAPTAPATKNSSGSPDDRNTKSTSSAAKNSSGSPDDRNTKSTTTASRSVVNQGDTGTPNHSSNSSVASSIRQGDTGTPNRNGGNSSSSGGLDAAAQQAREVSTLNGRSNGLGDNTTFDQLDDWVNDATFPARTTSQIRADLARAQHPGANFVPEGAYLDPMAQGTRPTTASIGPGGLDLAAIAHSLNGPYLKRVEQNQGVAPFEGPVDTAGIVRALNAPYYRANATPGPMDPLGSSQTWQQMQDYLDSPNTNTSLGVGNTASSDTLTPVAQPTLAQLQAMRAWSGSTGEHFDAPGVNPNARDAPYIPSQELQTNAYLGEGNTPALDGIAAAVDPATGIPLPRRDPRGYGDVFATDGQVTTPDGTVITQGDPVDITVRGGKTEEPKKPSTWDNVVDNTGKLLSHTGLGSIVSTLFPDQWNGMGDAFKGLDNGGPGSGQMIDGEAMTREINGGGDPFLGDSRGTTYDNNGSGIVQAAVAAAFPDVNHNGIDDRLEGAGATDTLGGNQFRSNRGAVFPDMPPYRPGIDNEWNYFHDHLARGGVVGYADGGIATAAGIPMPRPSPMIAPGNLDLDARKVYHGQDGSYRTENSISIGTGAGEVLIPTVVNGKQLSEKAAIAHYQKTGENLGTFANPADADNYAEQLHLRQAKKYAPEAGFSQGGVVSMLGGQDPRVMAIADAEDALHAGRTDDPAVAKFVSLFGPSALKQLEGHVGAGYSMRPRAARQITGPGGPTDDAIPAVIDGRHPAALSSGEVVIPVAAVAGAGDGDPRVGAEKLMALSKRLASAA